MVWDMSYGLNILGLSYGLDSQGSELWSEWFGV